jgi:CBS domain-containing protein
MPTQIREIMTPNPIMLDASASVQDAACQMRDRDVGNVLVGRQGQLVGIVTDRDLVVRCLADPDGDGRLTVGELCSQVVATLAPESAIEDAVEMMERHAVRRLPVVEGGAPVGIVSLGDLARNRDPDSALGQISSAPPGR